MKKDKPRYMGTIAVASTTFPATPNINSDIPLTQGVNISVPSSAYTLFVTLAGLTAQTSAVTGSTFGYAITSASSSPTIEFVPCSNINQLLFRGSVATSTSIGIMGV